MERLKDKVILLAGGGGISKGTALRLASEGAWLAIGDVRHEAAQEAAAAVQAAGGRAIGVALNIADEESVAAFVAAAVQEYGGIDGLFNVAADTSPHTIGQDTNPVDTALDVWKHSLDINLTGYFLTIRHVVPELLKRGGGAIVNTISASAYAGESIRVAYAASKAGVAALTRNVANYWGKDNIRCNSLAPGMILSGVQTQLQGGSIDFDEIWKGMSSQRTGIPSPRLGKPEDIAATVAFLLSADAAYINGQSIGVDGGMIFR